MGPVEEIRFGAFELNLETWELRRDGRAVRLSPKPTELLALLVRSADRLVTREAIRKALWGPDTFVDFEHALNFSIREVRAALGDNAKAPRFIETVPRRGYRFIAPTTTHSVSHAATNGASAADDREVEAHTYYVRARQSLSQAAKGALEDARRDFEHALKLTPDYALAHSGLGAVYGLRSLNRRHPEDLSAARAHLERALELDGELADPYPWLCYVLMRQNQVERAMEAGHRGVELQPDLVHAHYFLGLAYFAGAETDAAKYQNAARHLLEATRVDPHWQAAWFVLAYAALLTGRYEAADGFATRLREMNREPRGMPFIGAEIVLATVAMRREEPDEARALLVDFLERMAASDHMYRDAMSAAAACVLGELELRYGGPAKALAAFRRGWHAVQEHPRIAAYHRTSARAQSGMASAYAAMGERERANELLARAIETAKQSEPVEYAAAAASLAELYWSIAVACARMGDRAAALAMLGRAVKGGWRDAAWMKKDPELSVVRGDPEFQRLLGIVEATSAPAFEAGGCNA